MYVDTGYVAIGSHIIPLLESLLLWLSSLTNMSMSILEFDTVHIRKICKVLYVH